MGLIKRNLWLLFYVLCLSGLVFLIIVSYLCWEETISTYTKNQRQQTELVKDSLHSVLVTQEMMLDLMGATLLREGFTHKGTTSGVTIPSIFDQMLTANPSIQALGLLTPEGDYLAISGNVDVTTLPNLLEQKVSRDSFLHTLESRAMVLGRTYFFKPVGEWVIPIRKTLRDAQGKPLAVMAAALSMQHSADFFNNKLHRSRFNAIKIFRRFDYYIQYISSSRHEDMDRLYNTQIPKALVQGVLKSIHEQVKAPLDTLRTSGELYTVSLTSLSGRKILLSAGYDTRYEVWTTSQIDYRVVLSSFLHRILLYALLLSVYLFVLFWLFRLISQAEKQRENDLLHQATHDCLTRLPNREYLQRNIHSWIYDKAPPFALLFIDMDHFKTVNDSFGHEFGDLVLQEMAARLCRFRREGELVVRQGGDEFILLTKEHDAGELLELANRLIDTLSQAYCIEDVSFNLGTSIGISRYPTHAATFNEMLSHADIALYEAKKQRNHACMFLSGMQESYLHSVSVEQQLRSAIETLEEFFLVYQPQINGNGTFHGVEALVRWDNDRIGLVPPDIFIPIAETSGLMPKLGQFIVETALKEMNEFLQETELEISLSLNISLRQFMQKNFLEDLYDKLSRYQVPKITITLEITENLFIEDLDYLMPLLEDLSSRGVLISLDDFGTGYSSLSLLRRLPIDELKIDKTFVDDVLTDTAAEKMVQNIISIARNFDMVVVAEGVESQEQFLKLKEEKCDLFQGYYFSKPLRLQDLKQYGKAFIAT
nr:EAL domain-containing protein [uncultured Desulfuromonas sp.]